MFDCLFKSVLASADKSGNSLFLKILPATLCESIFCRQNQRLADRKRFDSNILDDKIQKEHSLMAPPTPRAALSWAFRAIMRDQTGLAMRRGLTPPNALPRLPVYALCGLP